MYPKKIKDGKKIVSERLSHLKIIQFLNGILKNHLLKVKVGVMLTLILFIIIIHLNKHSPMKLQKLESMHLGINHLLNLEIFEVLAYFVYI